LDVVTLNRFLRLTSVACLRQIEPVRRAVALPVHVDDLSRCVFCRNERRRVDDVFLPSRHSLKLRILLYRQGAMIDIALDDRGAVQLDAIGADRAFDAATDRQFLCDDIAFDLRTIADLDSRGVHFALDVTENRQLSLADDLAHDRKPGADGGRRVLRRRLSSGGAIYLRRRRGIMMDVCRIVFGLSEHIALLLLYTDGSSTA